MLISSKQISSSLVKLLTGSAFINSVESLPECCVNMLIAGSGTLIAAVLPGGVPVLLPGSRGLLPATLPRFPFPWCGWDAWGCGGWSPVDVLSPTRPTCCPIPVVWPKDVRDEASKPPWTPGSHSPKLEQPSPNSVPQSPPHSSSPSWLFRISSLG